MWREYPNSPESHCDRCANDPAVVMEWVRKNRRDEVVVTVNMLEALEAFHVHCRSGEDDWITTRDHYESFLTAPDGDVDSVLEEVVQDLFHLRWVPPTSDPLRTAALHARRGLPWRTYLPS